MTARRNLIPILFLCVIAAAGCQSSGPCGCGVDEDSPEESLFYPLETGNRWTYQASFSIGFYDPDSGALLRADSVNASWDVLLSETETIGGVEYIVETTIETVDVDTDTTWVRLRQDTSGLYRADIPRRIRPGDASLDSFTGPPDEIVRLRYPLFEGASWELVPAVNPVVATVETADTLSTPAGSLPTWRIRIDPPNSNPANRHFVWHGLDGKVQEEQHSEVTAIDDLTGERVRIVSDTKQHLLSFSLMQRDLISAENSLE